VLAITFLAHQEQALVHFITEERPGVRVLGSVPRRLRLCAVIGVCRVFVCEFCLQVIAGCVSSHCVESLEDLWSKLLSRSSFLNTPTKCSVKCPRGDKLFLSQVFVVYLLCGLISTS
jgi:hypothetical protein